MTLASSIQLTFPCRVTLGRIAKSLDDIGNVVEQDLSQPSQQLTVGLSPETRKALVRLGKGFLHQIRRSHLAADVVVEFPVGDQQKVVAAPLEQLSQVGIRPKSRRTDQVRSRGRVFVR